MAIFYIVYDLDKPGQQYEDLWNELDSLGAKRLQDSLFALNSDSTKEEIYKAVHAHMDKNDRLLVVKSGGGLFINLMYDPNNL
jgi:CRISPR/Cas system-associated endoribonuclease Cas2